MGYSDDRWMENVDVRAALAEMGIEVKHDRGRFVDCFCPAHEDPSSSKSPSWTIATEADAGKPQGIHLCRGCGWTGDLVDLYSQIYGLTKGAALGDLLRRWAPDDPRSQSAIRKKDLPTDQQVINSVGFFWSDKEAIHEFTKRRAWSKEWCERAHIGLDMGKLFIPVFGTEDNQLINCRWRKWGEDKKGKGPQVYGPSGRKPSLYPLNLIDLDKELIIVEGEMDVGALQSIEGNAVTYMGGAQSLALDVFRKILPKPGPESGIILCLDRDKEGRKAEHRLRNQLFTYGIASIRIVEVPHPAKDIEEHLRNYLP